MLAALVISGLSLSTVRAQIFFSDNGGFLQFELFEAVSFNASGSWNNVGLVGGYTGPTNLSPNYAFDPSWPSITANGSPISFTGPNWLFGFVDMDLDGDDIVLNTGSGQSAGTVVIPIGVYETIVPIGDFTPGANATLAVWSGGTREGTSSLLTILAMRPPDPLDPADPDVLTMDMAAINSANSTGTFLPNAQSAAQNNIVNTALNALHNQRIVRARSGMGNPRTTSDTLAQSDRHLSKFLHFAANQGMSLGQALGVEETLASVTFDDTMDRAEQLFSVEVPAGGKMTYEPKAPIEDPKRWEVFAVGDFGSHDQDALDTVNRGFQSRTWAGSVGFEYMVCKNFNFGMAYTYAENNTDLDEGLGNVDIEGHLASVYATGFFDNKYVDILYSYGTYQNDIRRNTLTAGGFALGSPDSDTHTFSINAGQNFDIGPGLVTGPTLGYDYTEGAIDAYNETAGGTAALNYLGRDYSSSISSLGWQITKTQEVKQGILSIQGFAAWEHEFNPEAGNVRASLATSPFAVNGIATGGFNLNSPGTAPGTDWLSLGIAARLACRCGLNLSVDYQTQLFRDDVTAHYAGLKLSGEF